MQCFNLHIIWMFLVPCRHPMSKSDGPFAVRIGTKTHDRAIRPISAGNASYCQGTGSFRMGIGTDCNAAIIIVGYRITRYRICIKLRSPKAVSPFSASVSAGGIYCNLYTCGRTVAYGNCALPQSIGINAHSRTVITISAGYAAKSYSSVAHGMGIGTDSNAAFCLRPVSHCTPYSGSIL